MTHIQGVILDVDGTLVDSNDAHTKSWVDALAEFGYTVPFAKIRPLIGKGGDKVLPEAIGMQSESDTGQKISQRRGEIFKDRDLAGAIAVYTDTSDLLAQYDHSPLA